VELLVAITQFDRTPEYYPELKVMAAWSRQLRLLDAWEPRQVRGV